MNKFDILFQRFDYSTSSYNNKDVVLIKLKLFYFLSSRRCSSKR